MVQIVVQTLVQMQMQSPKISCHERLRADAAEKRQEKAAARQREVAGNAQQVMTPEPGWNAGSKGRAERRNRVAVLGAREV